MTAAAVRLPTLADVRLPTLADVDVERMTRHFRNFAPVAWEQVEPHPYEENWHHRVLYDELEHVARTPNARLALNQPPGTTKSLLVSVLWPAWVWTWWPASRWIVCSYGDRLARRDADRVRRLCASAWYRANWPDVGVFPDDPVLFFRNRAGGFRFSTTMRGQVTGEHADFHVGDDMQKPVDEHPGKLVVVDPAELEEANERWRSTFGPRVLPGARKVFVQQRLHPKDSSGTFIPDGYRHVRMAMRREAEECPVREAHECWEDPRAIGELLWPSRIPEDEVALREREWGPRAAAAQLQQRPSPAGGGVFKRDWLALRYSSLPPEAQGVAQGATWAMAWDAAYKLTTRDAGSYVAGAVGCRVGSRFYITRVVRGRWGLDDTEREIKALVAAFPKATAKVIEDAAFGRPVAERLERDGITGIRLVKPEGGKAARAHAVVPIFAALQVFFPDGEAWVGETVEELARFLGVPGEENDRVDAIVHLIRYLSEYGVDAAFGKALPQALAFLRGLHGRR